MPNRTVPRLTISPLSLEEIKDEIYQEVYRTQESNLIGMSYSGPFCQELDSLLKLGDVEFVQGSYRMIFGYEIDAASSSKAIREMNANGSKAAWFYQLKARANISSM